MAPGNRFKCIATRIQAVLDQHTFGKCAQKLQWAAAVCAATTTVYIKAFTTNDNTACS